MNRNLKGVYTALLTPYKEDGSINRDSLSKLINFNLKAGITGFYVGGSTGEGVMMSEEERKELFRLVKEINGNRGVLIGHVGSTSTLEAVNLAKYVSKLGYDAVSAVAPFYYSHNYEAIKSYYYDIADASDLPVVVYNYPLSGSFTLTKDKAKDILKNKKIVAIKHTSQDLFLLERLKKLENAPIVFNGYDEMLAAGLIMGADGGIGSTYNFIPHKIVSLYNLFNEGKIKEVMDLQSEINDIIDQCIALSNRCGLMNIEREMLNQMGIEMGPAKKPFIPIDQETIEKVKPIANKILGEVKSLL